jgi:branched-chain amino acid transport system substrate-binding protein
MISKFMSSITVVLFCLWGGTGYAVSPIIIGLDADLKSGSARSGMAIKRGILLAVDQINDGGGMLGRPLALVARDHRGNPARGIANIEAFSETENLVAVVGGLHTPVALAELPAIHKSGLIYLSPWAAGTPVVSNGYSPNYVFRVSVRDEYAGPFLVRQALDAGYNRIGLLLEQTGWGRSNLTAITRALEKQGLEPLGVQWFLWGSRDLAPQVSVLKQAGAQAILFVGNSPEGAVLVSSMAGLPEEDRLPVISHWGITGGSFFERVENHLNRVDLKFLQTFSFLAPPYPERAKPLVSAYLKRWPGTGSARGIFAPAGTAHAYDLIFLLKMAVEKVGTIESSKVRDALETLGAYRGLVRDYDPPFTPDNHDALDAGDFSLAKYGADGAIEPVYLRKAESE